MLVQQVLGHRQHVLRVSGDLETTRQEGSQTCRSHQFGDPVLACSRKRERAGNPLLTQVPQDPPASIGLATRCEALPNPLHDRLVFLAARTGFTPTPAIGAARRNPKNPTQRGHGEAPHQRLDELVSHFRRASASLMGRLVKIPTAFFRTSTSSLRRAFWRWSFVNSSSRGFPRPGKG